jgi:hypothetical protein
MFDLSKPLFFFILRFFPKAYRYPSVFALKHNTLVSVLRKKSKGFDERVCISGGANEGKISLDCPLGHRIKFLAGTSGRFD